MEHAQALKLLGLDTGASTSAIEQAQQLKVQQVEGLLAKAPSDALKTKYQKMLVQLDEAAVVLKSGSPRSAREDDSVLSVVSETQQPSVTASEARQPSGSSSEQKSPLSQSKFDDLPNAKARHSQFEEQAKAELGLEPGQILAGRYEIKEQIGAGGMGAVYRAQDNNIGKEIAVKVLLPTLLKNERARERFMDEARISQQLSHPNIVNVFDVQQDGDFFFLTMELLEGQDLRSYMDNLKLTRQTVSQAETLRIVGELCDGMAHAHEVTIHRDIKPENIWLSGNGKVKVMDFGIARVQSTSQRTQTGAAMGTAYYMAPEQLQGRTDIDGRVDQYAIGVLLYEMLSGQVPAGRIESLNTVDKQIPKKLSQVVDKLLSSQPEQRYESVQDLKLALAGSSKGGVSLPRFSLQKLAIPALVIFALLLMGGVYQSGLVNLDQVFMSKEAKAQRKAASSKLLGEIKNYQKRLESGRRQLNSDLRDASRNDPSQEKYFERWQYLTDNYLFEGSALTELEGNLAMGETLLRENSFDAAEQTLRRVGRGYRKLWLQFSVAKYVLAAEKKANQLTSAGSNVKRIMV